MTFGCKNPKGKNIGKRICEYVVRGFSAFISCVFFCNTRGIFWSEKPANLTHSSLFPPNGSLDLTLPNPNAIFFKGGANGGRGGVETSVEVAFAKGIKKLRVELPKMSNFVCFSGYCPKIVKFPLLSWKFNVEVVILTFRKKREGPMLKIGPWDLFSPLNLPQCANIPWL